MWKEMHASANCMIHELGQQVSTYEYNMLQPYDTVHHARPELTCNSIFFPHNCQSFPIPALYGHWITSIG